MKKHDVIIIGGGPGGSTMAAYLSRAGVDCAVIEREVFPRFHIGESLLPASMPILKETGFYETLDSGKYIRKYGARFVDYRHPDEIYFGFGEGLNRDIPMAFEVERAQFDQDLLEHARKCGATVYQPERVRDVKFFDSGVEVTTQKGSYSARYVVDATGRDALLGRNLQERRPHADLNNVAVFSHYAGVKRREGIHEGDITIGLLPDAAWSWVIPFRGERTSVGVVCRSEVFKGGADLADYLDRSLSAGSHLRELMAGAERLQEVSVISNYSHHCDTYVGDRWIMVGDAAAFLDPIFSSGVHVSMMSAKLASKVVLDCMKTDASLAADGRGPAYQAELQKGVDRFHSLISLFYRTNFVEGMQKTLKRENMRQAFTSAVAGDMWNDSNILFEMKVLG